MQDQDPRIPTQLETALFSGYESFKSCIRFYGLFHISFISFLCMQLLAFLLFFSYFSQSLTAACGLALFFLTLFSYFVLLFFFQAKKPEQLIAILDRFCSYCKSQIPSLDKNSKSNLTLSKDLEDFALFLNQKEITFYSPPLNIKALAPLIQKFKIWLHWKNFHQMKELLLLESIELLISLVRQFPTDIEIHASLAEAYTKLCKIYLHPRKTNSLALLPWISPEYLTPFMNQQFLLYSNKAIEEFKILEDLSGKHPWVLAQLAEIYRLQEKTKEEIYQCEELLKLTPDNVELLFQLGVLYFQEGYSAKGLKIYETLQKDPSDKAIKLIQHYS